MVTLLDEIQWKQERISFYGNVIPPFITEVKSRGLSHIQ
jgi:hypothetical protein